MSHDDLKAEPLGRQSLRPVPNARPSKPDRVLIYAMNYTPELIGCGRYTGEIGDYLAKQGSAVEVVTTPPHYPGWKARDGYKAGAYKTETIGGIRINRCPIGLSSNMKGFGRAWAPISFALSSAPVVIWRILAFRPTQVLCIEPTLFAAPFALIAAKLVGAKTILHVQDLEIDAAFAVGHLKSKGLKSFVFVFEKIVLKAFDHIITISNKMKEKLLAKGLLGHKVSIIRNWVDTTNIFPLKGENQFRTDLQISNDNFVALYAGNIGIKQALHLVLDAAQDLLDKREIVFVIAGDGPEKAGLVERGVPNVRFLPLQPEGKLNELLNMADVHLLPQDSGAADLVLPSKLGGMLASGVPVIAMASQGTELYEFIGLEGVVIPPGNAPRMAIEIKALAELQPKKRLNPSNSPALEQLHKSNSMRQISEILESGAPQK